MNAGAELGMREQEPSELPVTGYFNCFSCRPGGKLAVHVSVRDGGPYRARLERVLSGDPNPKGPGVRFEDLSSRFDRTISGRRQPIHAGSYGTAPAPAHAPDAARTWSVLVWIAAPMAPRAVFAQEDGAHRVVLSAGAAGTAARVTWPGGELALSTGAALLTRRWHRMWLSADPKTGIVVLHQALLDWDAPATSRAQASGLVLPAKGTVLIAAEGASQPSRHFTGKLEAPWIVSGTQEIGTPSAGIILAAWDFAQGIDTTHITDTGPQACHGKLINLPTRGMVGAHWAGHEHCWRHAPADYAAIHFHDDDIDDCRWAPDFDLDIPDDLPSGAYVLHLDCAHGEDRVPFYVLPRRNGPFAKVAFLASTFTYQAYANHARGNFGRRLRERVQEWGAYPYNPDEYPVYGHSTYNRHADRSGIAISSRLRPMLTMRPGFLTFNDARGSGLRHYPADTHLLAWLEAKDIAFDIITDEDLDDEGLALLSPYKVVLTGSHPEYHTLGTLDALQTYTNRGGRLVYLGGNGFYWRIARSKAMPGVIEIRRAEGGIRAWDAESGEYFNALDGQLGGLWRRNRRPPQQLTGVGFSGQGLFEGTHYLRLPASYEPDHAWMFEGIESDRLGDYGLSGGGAAGFEIDRADFDLGTPPSTVILARSEDPPQSFVTVPEELLSHISTVNGETPEQLRRGEIVYLKNQAGGEVFSVGSITFCGSLWQDNGFKGPISRLLENVVRRFSR